jgi:hypothetical protein
MDNDTLMIIMVDHGVKEGRSHDGHRGENNTVLFDVLKGDTKFYKEFS